MLEGELLGMEEKLGVVEGTMLGSCEALGIADGLVEGDIVGNVDGR